METRIDSANLASIDVAARDRTRYSFRGLHLAAESTIATDGKALVSIPYPPESGPNGLTGCTLELNGVRALRTAMRAQKRAAATLSELDDRSVSVAQYGALPLEPGKAADYARVIESSTSATNPPIASIVVNAEILARTLKALATAATARTWKARPPTVILEIRGKDSPIVLRMGNDNDGHGLGLGLVMPVIQPHKGANS